MNNYNISSISHHYRDRTPRRWKPPHPSSSPAQGDSFEFCRQTYTRLKVGTFTYFFAKTTWSQLQPFCHNTPTLQTTSHYNSRILQCKLQRSANKCTYTHQRQPTFPRFRMFCSAGDPCWLPVDSVVVLLKGRINASKQPVDMSVSMKWKQYRLFVSLPESGSQLAIGTTTLTTG